MYLVILKDKTNFITTWYEKECHWSDDIYCVVKLLSQGEYISFDGENFERVEYDHL